MLGTLIGIIFTLIVLGVVWWAAQKILALIPLGEPFRTLIYILMVFVIVIVCLWVLATILGMAGIHVPMGFR